MARVCPNCEKESPSAANFCMFCNTQFVEEEQMSEEDKLRKELSDANEVISLQKKHLQTLEDQVKKHENVKLLAQSQIAAEKKKCEQIIAEKNSQIVTLTLQVEEGKKHNSKSSWGWIFLVLCVILSFLLIKIYSDKENKNSIISDLKYKIEQLENKFVTLKMEYEKLDQIKQENQKLKNEKRSMQIAQLKDNNQESNSTESNIDKNSDVDNINSNSSRYRVTTKAYFYDFENSKFQQRNAYLVENDVVGISMQISGYGYTEFVNREGKTTKGWVKMSDLSKIK